MDREGTLECFNRLNLCMAVTLYLSNDTSARAAGADCLAAAWADIPDIRVVRTSSRGAFFLEPLVERDGPHGRLLWPRAEPDDLSQQVRQSDTMFHILRTPPPACPLPGSD